MFWKLGTFKKMYSQGLIDPDDLEYELEAQFEKYTQTCGEANYWNTHEKSSHHIS